MAVLVILYLSALRMATGGFCRYRGDVLASDPVCGLHCEQHFKCGLAVVMVPHAAVACRRILQVLDLPDDERENGTNGTLHGNVTLEHVTFSFEEGAEPAVRDVTMEIFAGKRVAIIRQHRQREEYPGAAVIGLPAARIRRILLDGRDSLELSGFLHPGADQLCFAKDGCLCRYHPGKCGHG